MGRGRKPSQELAAEVAGLAVLVDEPALVEVTIDCFSIARALDDVGITYEYEQRLPDSRLARLLRQVTPALKGRANCASIALPPRGPVAARSKDSDENVGIVDLPPKPSLRDPLLSWLNRLRRT
jgi:hypothetical protein